MIDTKFYVAETYRYKESGSWEYRMVGMYSDLLAAKQMFHSRLSAIIKNTNDFAMVILYDSFGNRLDYDVADFTAQPEPDPEPDAE